MLKSYLIISWRNIKRNKAYSALNVLGLAVGLAVFILIMQSVSELIKRIAFLTGHLAEPFTVEHEISVEEQLAKELAIEAEARLAVRPAGNH